MTLKNKVVISAVATLVFWGLLSLTSLKNETFVSSPLSMVIGILAIVSLVYFVISGVIFLIRAMIGKNKNTTERIEKDKIAPIKDWRYSWWARVIRWILFAFMILVFLFLIGGALGVRLTTRESSVPSKQSQNSQTQTHTCSPGYKWNSNKTQCVAILATPINTNPDVACDPRGCISLSKFSSNISDILNNQVVGYVSIVGKLSPSIGGLAHTSADLPSLAMSPNLPSDIASVSKVLTTVAVLQLLAQDGISVNAAISSYIYSDWVRGPNISRITFKELLTHTSGLGQLSACGNGNAYSLLKAIVANGVQLDNIGVPQYGNCNFTLLREIMPTLLGQSITNLPDDQRAQQSSNLYIDYMNSHVFQPLGIPTRACKPPADNNDILSYVFPAGSTHGYDWGDLSLGCGAGGWMLSAEDVFKVINSLATGNVLLTNAEKQNMFDSCLGWDCFIRSDCPYPYVCKNGHLNNGNGISLWTYAGIFKCNVPVVVFVNSAIPSPYQDGEDIVGLVKNAYYNASVAGTPQTCP